MTPHILDTPPPLTRMRLPRRRSQSLANGRPIVPIAESRDGAVRAGRAQAAGRGWNKNRSAGRRFVIGKETRSRSPQWPRGSRCRVGTLYSVIGWEPDESKILAHVAWGPELLQNRYTRLWRDLRIETARPT